MEGEPRSDETEYHGEEDVDFGFIVHDSSP